MHEPIFWDHATANSQALELELLAGLTAPAASISPKFFYDALGSSLFASICELDEYYPTRTEAGIFARYGNEMATLCEGGSLIDLGAGDCAKAESLFSVLRPQEYLAVDISVDYLRRSVSQLQQRYPHIKMMGLGSDFSAGLTLPDAIRSDKRIFFYPGSSISNFNPPQACKFLSQLGQLSGQNGGILFGVDMVKPKPILELAYDDCLGVTAAFNLNALRQTNRILGANFDLRQWKHVAFFNEQHNRIEMHLEATKRMTVSWAAGPTHARARSFETGERILTEYSHKYTPESVESMLAAAGLRLRASWYDSQQWFGVFFASPG
jgi:dimethylhistidine N-methyltransferase